MNQPDTTEPLKGSNNDHAQYVHALHEMFDLEQAKDLDTENTD